MELVDMQGRLVRTLFSGALEEGEMRKLQVQRGDLAAGMYLLNLRGPGIREVKKWTLL